MGDTDPGRGIGDLESEDVVGVAEVSAFDPG